MAQIYITENKAVVGIENGRVEVEYSKELRRSFPIETVEGITVIGNAQISTKCLTECLKKGIPMQFYSPKGFYFGKLSSTQHGKTQRQKLQIKTIDDSVFSLTLAKIILKAKISNQIVILKRYNRTSTANIEEHIRHMQIMLHKTYSTTSVEELCGYEGNAARAYYKSLNLLLNNEDFKFNGRSRQPPRDAFNSMLSLGYTILMNYIYGALENRGLNPYFGFIHKDRDGHPTLASDMIEEWRSVIVDSVVMSLINGNEIKIDSFYKDEQTQGVFLKKEGLKIFINKLENRLNSSMKYLDYVEHSVSFRRAIDLQALQLCKAIEENEPSIYKPIIIT